MESEMIPPEAAFKALQESGRVILPLDWYSYRCGYDDGMKDPRRAAQAAPTGDVEATSEQVEALASLIEDAVTLAVEDGDPRATSPGQLAYNVSRDAAAPVMRWHLAAVEAARVAERAAFLDYIDWLREAGRGAETLAMLHGHQYAPEVVAEGVSRRAALGISADLHDLRTTPSPAAGGETRA